MIFRVSVGSRSDNCRTRAAFGSSLNKIPSSARLPFITAVPCATLPQESSAARLERRRYIVVHTAFSSSPTKRTLLTTSTGSTCTVTKVSGSRSALIPLLISAYRPKGRFLTDYFYSDVVFVEVFPAGSGLKRLISPSHLVGSSPQRQGVHEQDHGSSAGAQLILQLRQKEVEDQCIHFLVMCS